MTVQELREFQRRIVGPFPPSIVSAALPRYPAAFESILANMRRAEHIVLGQRLTDIPRQKENEPMATISDLTTADAVIEAAAPPPKSRLVTRDPNRIEFAKDFTGRVIGAKPIDAIAMFDITCLMGEHSGNGAALNQALMASSVVKINDRDVFRPATMAQLRARIQELGFHGYAAASECVARFNEDGDVNLDALKN